MLSCFQIRRRIVALLLGVFLSATLSPEKTHAAGVTIITHGLNSNVDDWVIAMAGRMAGHPRFPGTNFTCYELYFVQTNSTYALTWKRLGGSAPTTTDSGEIFVKLDWRQLANNSYNTYEVAALVVPRLLQTSFISELNGHALAELPLHLVGHSRGGSLICQMSRLLGTNGVWVDHLTTLDPHPLNNDGFSDYPYTEVDAPERTYENVLFHDDYFQNLNLLFYGEPIAGAYTRELANLDGGYGGISASHSDVHLWYHGTVDLRVPADDTVATITSAERQKWWTPYESAGARAGYYLSRVGGGDRLASDQPDGPGTGRIRDGYNQRWDLGAGVSNNRTALPLNNGSYPNLLRINLSGTNLIAQGQSNAASFYYQWAKSANSNATVSLFLDDDFNPSNGNEHLVRQFPLSGTTSNNVGFVLTDMNIAGTNTTPGVHSLYASITGGGRTRYLYAPELVTVFSSFQAPRLAISRDNVNSLRVRVDVNGVAGQRVVLQSTTDFRTWQSLATNWLVTDRWSYFDTLSVSGAGRRFYRGTIR